MPVDERYRRQVDLLVRTLPHVAQEKCFALKGGTAINLFVRNLPRLSVDIDLTYLPVAGRARSLENIEVALRRIGERIEGAFPFARVQAGVLREEGTVNKLFVRERGTQIKVEVSRCCAAVCSSRRRRPSRMRSKSSSALPPFRCFVPGPVRRQAGGGSRSRPLAGVHGFRGVTPMDTPELQELVDAPRERLDVEYKAWPGPHGRGSEREARKASVCASESRWGLPGVR